MNRVESCSSIPARTETASYIATHQSQGKRVLPGGDDEIMKFMLQPPLRVPKCSGGHRAGGVSFYGFGTSYDAGSYRAAS